jgi:hypothetical protein
MSNFDLFGNVDAAEPMFGVQIGKTVLRTHAADKCAGEYCCLHNPSDHPLKDAPLNWRGDRQQMERICSHGVGHPDKDSLEFAKREGHYETHMAVHGCDGCC